VANSSAAIRESLSEMVLWRFAIGIRNRRLEVRILSGVLSYVKIDPPLSKSHWQDLVLALIVGVWDQLPEAVYIRRHGHCQGRRLLTLPG
jgi:hypothetical protein